MLQSIGLGYDSQFNEKVKTSLGYASQFNEKEVLDVKEEEVTQSVFDNCSRDEENSLANDRFKKDRMAKKSVLPNNVGMGTSHRESRPVWNNVQRTNHQNKFAPTIVFTRSERIPVSAAKPKTAASTSAAKPVNTAGPKQSVNFSKSRSTFHKSHSPIRRSFYNAIAHSRRNSTKRVNTAGSKAVGVVKGNRGHPQQALKNKGIVDSGCSRKSEKFSETVTPLFASMLAQSVVVEGKGSGNPPESQPTPFPAQPITESQILESSSSPQNTQSPRQTLEGNGFPHTRGPNFPDPSADVESVHKERGEGLGSGPGCQETMGGAIAQIRSEGAPIQSSDPPLLTSNTVGSGEDRMEHAIKLTDPIPQTPHDSPLSGGHTPGLGSGEDRMEHAIKLTDPIPQTPHDSPLSGGHTPGCDEGSMTLKELTDLCTTLSHKVLDLEKDKTAQAKEIASLKTRVTKLEQRQSSRILSFYPSRAGTSRRHILGRRKVIVEDKGSGEKGGSIAETVSTARPDISATRPKVSTAEPKTPLTTITFFDDEDVTIVDTLVKMKNQKAKEKEVAFKDAYDSARPIRSIATLQLLPTIDPKDKVALKIQANLDEEVRTERERQKKASMAALAKLYDEVQVQIDVDHELAAKLTYEEAKKYKIKERNKRVAGSSSKHKSPKKQKVNDQEYVDSDKELRKCLKVVPDDDKAINYETLDVKSPTVDCESQMLGTMEAGDVHVYKLTRLYGSYRHFLTFFSMLEVFDRQDVLDFHKIIMERFLANDPEAYDLILWGDLKTLIKSSDDDEIWRNQQNWKLMSWKLYETCGVYTLMLDDSLVSINMFVEKRYPLTKEILEKMLSWRLEAKTESTLALDMIKFIKLQIEEK
nr:hypothetical protein [Tanacetum cinerariifolium]